MDMSTFDAADIPENSDIVSRDAQILRDGKRG